MKRAISDPHNPGVASVIYRSGMSEFVLHKYGKHRRAAVEQRRAVRLLHDAGLISHDRHVEMLREIDRRVVAQTLRNIRKNEPFAVRIKALAGMRKIAPLGVSTRDVKMGKVAHA